MPNTTTRIVQFLSKIEGKDISHRSLALLAYLTAIRDLAEQIREEGSSIGVVHQRALTQAQALTNEFIIKRKMLTNEEIETITYKDNPQPATIKIRPSEDEAKKEITNQKTV